MGSTLPCTALECMHIGNVDKWFGWWKSLKMITVWNDKFAVWFFSVWSCARLSGPINYHFVGSRCPASALFGKFRHGWFKVSCRFERGVSAARTCRCKTFAGCDPRKTWSNMLSSHAAWWKLQDRRGGVDRKPTSPATRTWSRLRFAKLVAASGNAEIALGATVGGFRTATAAECSISAWPDSVGFETCSPWFAHRGGWPPPSLFEGTKMVAESASKASDESDSFLWDSQEGQAPCRGCGVEDTSFVPRRVCTAANTGNPRVQTSSWGGSWTSNGTNEDARHSQHSKQLPEECCSKASSIASGTDVCCNDVTGRGRRPPEQQIAIQLDSAPMVQSQRQSWKQSRGTKKTLT